MERITKVCLLLLGALAFMIACNSILFVVYEKEDFNREFEAKVWQYTFDMIEGREGAKNNLLEEIKKTNQNALDDKSKDLIGRVLVLSLKYE